jgi:hypothetical protein
MLDSTDDSVVVRQVLQECLEHRMSDISEDCYCAGWLNNLEHSLFNLMLKAEGISVPDRSLPKMPMR